MTQFFTLLYSHLQNWKKLFFLLSTLLLGVLIYFASQVRFEEDITKILPSQADDMTMKVMQQMNFSDNIVVMIEAKNSKQQEKLGDVAQSFLDSLQQEKKFFAAIKGKVDGKTIEATFNFVRSNLPLFLNEQDYQKIAKQLSKDSIASRMQGNFNTLTSPVGSMIKNIVLNDPLGISLMGLEKMRKLGVSKDFIIYNGFIHSADTSTIVIFVKPKFSGTDTKNNKAFIQDLYRFQHSLNKKYSKTAKISYFGAPFVADANATQIKADIQHTVVISLTILMLILIFFYRQIYVPIVIFIPTIFGVAAALAVLYFTNDSISAISVSIGSILVGITVDYPLHIITHYRESTDVKLLFKNITKPILASSLTTSIAFLCLIFVDSKVLADLGVFAFVTVMVAALVSLVIIPHLYIPKTEYKPTLIDKFASYKFEKSKIILGITIVAFIIGIFTVSKVEFNNDISSLNYVPPHLKASEKQFEHLGSIGGKSVYVSVYGDTLANILNKNNALVRQLDEMKTQGLISDYSSVGNLFLSEEKQLEKIKQWEQFWTSYSADSIVQTVNQEAINLGFKTNTFSGLKEVLHKTYKPITSQKYQTLKTLQLDELLTHKNGLFTLSTLIKTDSLHRSEVIQQLKQENIVVIDRKEINESFLTTMLGDFKQVTNYSILAVFLILFLFFKRIELALLNIIPIVLIGFVTVTFVYFLGLEFNVFSTIVSSLIVGAAVDFSVYMTSGLQKRYTYGKDELPTYRTSIALALLTTILALGVLVFAKHPALKSISWVTLIGNLSALFIIFTVYPILFKFFIEKRPIKGKAPATLRLLISAIISFGYFTIGCLLLSLFGITILPLLPIKNKKTWFRKVTAKFLKSVMFSNIGTRNKFLNPHNEKFEKPAFYVANHSSFLDTLSVGFIPTPLIFLVNDWVYHSPVFGKLVQSNGYFPTSKGIESWENDLAKTLKEGTSAAVFPEGTRSMTGAIARFHKGVFYMAMKYNIDIVPVYIHGNSELIPKSDFIIFDGYHTIEIGERISFEDMAMSDDEVRKQTKAISKKFKNKFQEIRNRLEHENYFKQKIKFNFLYKTDGIDQLGKQEFEANKSLYHALNPHIGSKAKILRIGDDYGVWDMMLTLQQQRRKVFTFIEDTSKRAVAQQSYLTRKRNIQYLDKPTIENTDTLLITSVVREEELLQLVQKNNFKTLIFTIKMYNLNDFIKLNYQTSIENESFCVFEKCNDQ